MTDTIAITSKEAVLVDVYTDVDPTGPGGLTPSFAFVAYPDPDAPEADAADVWHEATWDGDATLQTSGEHRGQYLTVARIIIGPESAVDDLELGRHRVYLWLDGADIDPIKRAGDIVIVD